MGALSVWHWLIVFGIVGLVVAGRKPRHGDSYAAAGIHVHTATQYICAALHTGHIDPQATIDRLQDRHKAKLPELGINTARILSEAKKARRRKAAFSIAALFVLAWIASIGFDYFSALDGNESNEVPWQQLLAYGNRLIKPLLLMTLIGFAEIIVINAYLKTRIIPLTDGPDHDTQQNVVIFGGFSPFAGYGGDLDNWSFTIDASKASDEHSGKPEAFEQVELLDFISRELEANVVLGDSYDGLFVNGRRIRGKKLFLYDIKSMPNTAISPAIMKSKIGRPDQDGRHYRLFSTSFANGHLFLTYFFRSTMVGDNLFIESRCFLLTPIKSEFTELNELPVKRGFVYYFEQLGRQLLIAPVTWVRGPIFLLERSARLGSKAVRAIFGDPEDKLKARQETYNYGQSNSLRESWASNLYHTYFQMLDKDMISKTCQHIIINSIVEFLDGKGIATDDIKERRTQIFNSGVIVSGGVVNAQQLAVGKGATAKAKISNAFSSGRR